MKKIALLIILIGLSGPLYSQEIRFINDVLVVQLRTGPSFNHRNFKGLVTGTRLTLLETTEDDKWARVKIPGGEEGWVPTQYLSTEPAARDVLQSTQRELEKLKQQNAELETLVNELSQREEKLRTELSSTTGSNKTLSTELEHIKSVSSNAIDLDRNNKQLLKENQSLKNNVDVLNTENQRLKDSRDRDEFMNGAFAVLIGVFITLIVPRLWPKKRDEWA